jgi:hypothetical protein
MSKKQPEPQKPVEEQLLEQRVDDMMDPKRSSSAAPTEEVHVDTPGADLPPLDIFAGSQTAPEVPDDLLKQIGIKKPPPKPVAAEVAAVPAEIEPQPSAAPATSLELDDAATDAAVDDIVAHEQDAPSGIEDASEQPKGTDQSAKKKHRHPLFWSLVTILALLAVVTAALLASGGNASFPGSDKIQSWWNSATSR